MWEESYISECWKVYYDEQTEMYEQMKKEQDEHEQSLSVEEREKEHQKLFQEARTIMEKAERKKKKNIRSSIL